MRHPVKTCIIEEFIVIPWNCSLFTCAKECVHDYPIKNNEIFYKEDYFQAVMLA